MTAKWIAEDFKATQPAPAKPVNDPWEPAPKPAFTDTCIEHAYGSAVRLSFQIRVF